MRYSVLPVMTVLTVIAGAVGLQLGETTIAQIDPLYFQGAAPPPRDVTKDPRTRRHPAFAEASGWAEGYQAQAEDCGDCPALLTRRTHAPVEPLYAYSDPTIEPRWEQAEAELTEAELVFEPPAGLPRVQRYLHYPISDDQTAIRASLDGAAEPAEGPSGL